MQCDGSIDISNCSQLLVYVRFLKIIKEQLSIGTTGSRNIDVMNIITKYIRKYDIKWEKLVGFCTNGELQKDVRIKLWISDVNQIEESVSTLSSHCIIHRQALSSKTLLKYLNNTTQLAIKVMLLKAVP